MAYTALSSASRPRLAATILPDTIYPPGTISFPVFVINDSTSCWAGRLRWRMEALCACEVLTAEKSKLSSPLRTSVEGSYVMPLPGVEEVKEEGAIEFVVESGRTLAVGAAETRLFRHGPYRLVLSWESGGGTQENDYTILIASPGWQPEPGMTVVKGT